MFVFVYLIGGLFSDVSASNCFDSMTDICNADIPQIPNLQSRDPAFVMTNDSSHWSFCDVYSINTYQWYKSEVQMSTNCPGMYMCGTKFPIWMNGSNPKPLEGVVNRTSCLRDFDSCCLHTYKLTAVNCRDFMAYCFIDLPTSCHQRYCFDKGPVSTSELPHTTSDSTNDPTVPGSTTQRPTKYPITKDSHERTAHLSSSVKYTPTYGGTASMKYASFSTALGSTSQSSSGVQDTSSNTFSTKATTERYDASKNLLTIAISMIGLLTAVICGLLIVICRRRVSKVSGEKDKTKVYETLKRPDSKGIIANENMNVYRIVSFEKSGCPAKVDGKFGDTKNICQTNNSGHYGNSEYHVTNIDKELYDVDEHYVTLP